MSTASESPATTAATHHQHIIDQFTQQSARFVALPIHSASEAMEMTFAAVGLSAQDRVLDVACGPGLVACAAAAVARQVDGIDVTPAMLDRARQQQTERGLDNVSWHEGDVRHLPWDNGTFDVVLSRYAFHHFLSPAEVIAEMVRVCAVGGRVMLIDAAPPLALRAGYDLAERLRDPSHTSALPVEVMQHLGAEAGLVENTVTGYTLEVGLEEQLAASAPTATAAETLRNRLTADADEGIDRHGLAPYRAADGSVRLRFPIAVVVWHKPA